MRGDSIRDRYAKGLALVGLGLLAGAGAIVDYWPTRGLLPLVPPAARELGVTVAAGAFDPLTIDVAAPVVTRRAVRTPLSARSPVLRVSVVPRTYGTPILLTMPAAPVPPAEPLPAAPLAVLASAGAPTSVGGESLILPPPASPGQVAEWAFDSEDDSFLTGAVKRTGASILRTSAKAGASVFDAVRSLGGAVRRALPD